MSGKSVRLNEKVIKGQIGDLVCGGVEEIPNELLEKQKCWDAIGFYHKET